MFKGPGEQSFGSGLPLAMVQQMPTSKAKHSPTPVHTTVPKAKKRPMSHYVHVDGFGVCARVYTIKGSMQTGEYEFKNNSLRPSTKDGP